MIDADRMDSFRGSASAHIRVDGQAALHGSRDVRVPVERDAEPVRIKTYCEMQHEVTVSSSSPDFI